MEITALKILLTLLAKLFFLQLFVLDKNGIEPGMIWAMTKMIEFH